MKTLTLRKKSGGTRTVVAPSKETKELLRARLPDLNILQLALCDLDVVHGCIPGANPVSGASRHIGFEFTLMADLQAFFDNVFAIDIQLRFGKKFGAFLPGAKVAYFKPEGGAHRAAQGLPTSPGLANLRAIDLDRSLKLYCQDHGDIVYTRYVDDLAFSSNDRLALLELRAQLPEIIARHDLQQNSKKTRLLWAGPDRSWRRPIYGVAVGETDIKPTRRTRRKYRAARYKGRKPGFPRKSAQGFREWMRLKQPAPAVVRREETHNGKKDTVLYNVNDCKKAVWLPVVNEVIRKDLQNQKDLS